DMCPAELAQGAVVAVRTSARQAQRPPPAEVVQYIVCAVRLDRAEAYGLAKAAIGEMLPSFWALGQRVPSAKAALLQAAGVSEADFATAVGRLHAGEHPSHAPAARSLQRF